MCRNWPKQRVTELRSKKKDRACVELGPQRKGVMKRRTGAIEREKRDVAKGKARIKTEVLWASETHTRKERALPPPFETDGFVDESEQSQAQAQAPKPRESRLKRTRQARPTSTMPLRAATSTAARLFSDLFQPPDRCARGDVPLVPSLALNICCRRPLISTRPAVAIALIKAVPYESQCASSADTRTRLPRFTDCK